MKNWFGTFGFSYIGAVFLLLLFIPNLIWSRQKPKDYTADGESKILRAFEMLGQIAVTAAALRFSDFNLRPLTLRSVFLAATCFCILFYELWWIRYFKSEKRVSDFYSSFCGIPVAGAVLPVFAFFFLGIYGKNIWMLLSCALLGVGHIGIHVQHKKELKPHANTKTENQ